MSSAINQRNSLGFFSSLPDELLDAIVEKCDVESQGNLYSTCEEFQSIVGERIFKEKLESLHLPLPKNARYHAALAGHYREFTKKFVEIFDLKHPNTGSSFADKSLVTQQVSQQQIDKHLNTNLHDLTIMRIYTPESLIQLYDSRIQILLESRANVPERQLSVQENPRQEVIKDLLYTTLAYGLSPRTILLMIDHPNQEVVWNHLRFASDFYGDDVLQAMLKKVTENPRIISEREKGSPENLLFMIPRIDISDTTKIGILNKISKVSFSSFRAILDLLYKNRMIISDELLIALLEKADITSKAEADFIIKWFSGRCLGFVMKLTQEISLEPLGHFLDIIRRSNIPTSGTSLKEYLTLYSPPENPLYLQEEILCKLVRSIEHPIDLSAVEIALLHKHSDDLLLQILEKGNQDEIARQEGMLKFSIENNPRFPIIKKLLEIGCSVDTSTLKKALTGKYNPDLQDAKSRREFPSDETIFLVLDSYLSRDEAAPAKIFKVLQIAFSQGASDGVIKKLLRIADGYTTFDVKEYKLFLRKARRQNRPPEIIALLEAKSPSSCLIQ